ncbi:hypothetical protein NDU88_000035 [Pleurodeles waltl]|uniref:Uncharacterized protein n=1 Tax=Pleurodeles waltl TaxID=8319 RepID=A0AAV7MFP9_PLEWA|nr:hypothetical protein NDU88_000035 [Pleurodeles waltl]
MVVLGETGKLVGDGKPRSTVYSHTPPTARARAGKRGEGSLWEPRLYNTPQYATPCRVFSNNSAGLAASGCRIPSDTTDTTGCRCRCPGQDHSSVPTVKSEPASSPLPQGPAVTHLESPTDATTHNRGRRAWKFGIGQGAARGLQSSFSANTVYGTPSGPARTLSARPSRAPLLRHTPGPAGERQAPRDDPRGPETAQRQAEGRPQGTQRPAVGRPRGHRERLRGEPG